MHVGRAPDRLPSEYCGLFPVWDADVAILVTPGCVGPSIRHRTGHVCLRQPDPFYGRRGQKIKARPGPNV